MRTTFLIVLLSLIVSNHTYGSNRGDTEPVEETSIIDLELKLQPFTELHFYLEGMANCGCKKGEPFTNCDIYGEYEGFVGKGMTLRFYFPDNKIEVIKVDDLLKAGSFRIYFKDITSENSLLDYYDRQTTYLLEQLEKCKEEQ